VEGTERLMSLGRQELYQIAQEALNNALKHTRAQSVWILLDFHGSATRLEVSGDGCGFMWFSGRPPRGKTLWCVAGMRRDHHHQRR
jgi:signal transduction histidine kinase